MAGPGGGPPRRSHTKSRKGCEACKRRHIRCDENFPQCRNCTKHKTRCPYNEIAAERSATPDTPNLMWTPEIEHAISEWQQTGIFPFPDLGIVPYPNPSDWTREELRLMYHITSLYHELAAIDGNDFTVWTRHIPIMLKIGATTPYVMHALLAFSAMHITSLTKCPLVGGMGFRHRGLALSGLHEAISSFSRETSDAILAASLVLSWQATDWRGWTQLMQGTSAVIEAMDEWKHESQFGDFIAEKSTFPTAPPSPGPEHRTGQPSQDDLHAYDETLSHLQKFEAFLKLQKEDSSPVQHLISFLKGSRRITPALSIAHQYERLRHLRDWLFWLPVALLQKFHGSPNSLAIIAQLFTSVVLMERIYPEIGAGYFASLSITPVEEIARRLMSINVASGEIGTSRRSGNTAQTQTALDFVQYPVHAIQEFRLRMGWIRAQDSPSGPYFEPQNVFGQQQHIGMPNLMTQTIPQAMPQAHDSYLPYGNSVYSYSAGDLSVLNAPAPSPLASGSSFVSQQPFGESPFSTPVQLSGSPFANEGHYLSIPSPSLMNQPSPASSTFSGSIAYSDTDDYALLNMSGLSHGSPMVHDPHHSGGRFGVGFVSPHHNYSQSI